MLEIRRVTAADTEALLQVLGDPEVAYWLRPAGVIGAFSRDECEAIIARKLAHWDTHGIGMSLGFIDGCCAGRSTIGYSLVDGRAELEVGWAVARDMWGCGLATELGRHALATASAAGFERIVAFTRTDNVGSRRVMQKLGLRYSRDFMHTGHPHVLYLTGGV
ncbi:MAG TPA: GNAT family N-acetyltransferase [Solirubrobacteraceae bacterium]|jgi:RimJ/RimL family protein N-acetyltransferase|nr:GNAT family N-acetyltransferase [Solirubrobacteraceae bacterium]